MAALNRASLLAIGVVAVLGMFPQTARQDFMLDEIASGKTRVLDLSYAINDKLVRWPGDEKVFEAKVNASVEKNGYFTRSFWMLEHYGTHLDASAHFPLARPPPAAGGYRSRSPTVSTSSWHAVCIVQPWPARAGMT